MRNQLSCRASDDVVAVAHMCAEFGVPHMINNAYGIQSASICRDITAAWRKGAHAHLNTDKGQPSCPVQMHHFTVEYVCDACL